MRTVRFFVEATGDDDLTLEQNFLLDFSDILGMVFECQNKKCLASVTIDIHKAEGIISKCPSCHTRWLEDDTQEYGAILDLLKLLKGADEALRGRPLKLKLLVPALSASQM